MNWFTKEAAAGMELAEKEHKVELNGGCEHVVDDPSTLYQISYENDSFGREGYCMCKACAEEAREAELKEEYCCHYCKKTFELKDGILWKWYDFYEPQGDEPMPVCNACKDGEAHQRTVTIDRANRDDELSDDGWDEL